MPPRICTEVPTCLVSRITSAPMSDTAATKIVIETIDLLEFRLRRLEFYLSGHDSQDILLQAASQGKDGTINTRLERIHVALETLSSKSRVVNDVLNLCKAF